MLLLFATTAVGQQSWPKRVVDDAKLRLERVRTATLPAALRETLLSFDEFTQGAETLPETLEVCQFDLNRDGTPEFIVASPASYSGGTARFIYQRTRKGYRSIAYIQGGFHVAEPHNGYYQIECWGRAGGGQLTRTLERYERSRYRRTRIEDYTDDDRPRFIRSRDPKASD